MGYQPHDIWHCLVLLGLNAFAFANGAIAAPTSETDSPAAKGQAAMASLTGKITFQGNIPLMRVANDLGTRLPLLTVDAKHRGWQSVLVYLESLDAKADSRPDDKPPVDGAVTTVDQRGMMFTPHLIAVRDNQVVRFTNSDSANHNVRAVAINPRNEFNTFTGPCGKYEHRFQFDAKRRPVLIGCDIHAWMRAWIFVFDHNYYSVSDAEGSYRIDDLPPGTYRLELRQPDAGLKVNQEIKLRASEKKELNWEFREQDLKLD